MPQIRSIVWGSSFKKAFHRRVCGTPEETLFTERMKLFLDDPFDPRLTTHKLSGRLKGLWAFSIGYDCRVIFQFLSRYEVLLVNIGSHDEVY